jgi:tetratricopeptide (TPR) repeat protein
MKPSLRLLAIPLICQSLLCSQVFAAKKDKTADSETPDRARQEESATGPRKKAQPNKTERNARKQDKPAKPEPQPAQKKKEPAPKKENPPTRTDNKKADSPKKADTSKQGDSTKQTGKNKDDPSGKATKNKAPMILPGNRPDTETAKNKNQGSAKQNDKASQNTKGTASNKKVPTSKKALVLPGKRPKVQVAKRPAISKTRKQDSHPKVASSGDKNKVVRKQGVVRPGQNTRQVRRPELQKNVSKTWWTNNRQVNTTKNVRVTNTTVINQNFQRNVNWTTGRRNWGYNPWWNRTQVRPWYGSSWSGSWNRNYYRDNYYYERHHGYRPPGYVSATTAIGWGLIGWSLGTLIYDTGYHSYHNPYPVRAQVVYRGSNFDYSQPITRVAVNTAPEDEAAVEEINQRSESIIADSQDAFKQRNYLVALELADKAIAESPGDGALHEYRALVLFALGKYGDAAGVLNPVLASGPGWDWSTMIALYDSQQTYTDQLQKLEAYTEAQPDSADTHFLLGYHYMVCGHTDLATPQFDLAAELMPADSVSRQLGNLTRSSADPEDDTQPAEDTDASDTPEAEPVPLEKLTGTWTSRRDDGSTVTLSFKDDGKFVWSYLDEGKTTEFSGDYSMNDNGLLVLDSEESQMVASVDMPEDQSMNFVLAGGPPDDPGLDFTKG